MTRPSIRAWIACALAIILLLMAAFGLGFYMGDRGETKPTVPPWPQPVPRKTPTALIHNSVKPAACLLSWEPVYG